MEDKVQRKVKDRAGGIGEGPGQGQRQGREGHPGTHRLSALTHPRGLRPKLPSDLCQEAPPAGPTTGCALSSGLSPEGQGASCGCVGVTAWLPVGCASLFRALLQLGFNQGLVPLVVGSAPSPPRSPATQSPQSSRPRSAGHLRGHLPSGLVGRSSQPLAEPVPSDLTGCCSGPMLTTMAHGVHGHDGRLREKSSM